MRYLIVDRYEWVMRRKRSCRTLPVHQKSLLFAVHHVLLNLGDVMRDVVDDVHVQIIWRGVEHFGEGLKVRINSHQHGLKDVFVMLFCTNRLSSDLSSEEGHG